MTELQLKVMHSCIEQLYSTLGSMSASEADKKVREVGGMLKCLIKTLKKEVRE